MAMRRMRIVNIKGLHARASARLVEVVERFDASATVRANGETASGDSIMGLLMLAAAMGDEIEVETTGTEADALLASIVELVASGFGEEN